MNRTVSRLALCAVVLSIASIPALAAEPAASAAKLHHPAAASVLMPESELKWSDVPDNPGVKMAPVHGDPGKGPSHFFIKLPAGFSAGMHFHNADHWVAVVSGTLVLTPEGGAEKRLPAGSGFGFTGKKRHTTKCADGADCVLFVDARSKWDVIPVGKK